VRRCVGFGETTSKWNAKCVGSAGILWKQRDFSGAAVLFLSKFVVGESVTDANDDSRSVDCCLLAVT
jgi:hypothetical protein